MDNVNDEINILEQNVNDEYIIFQHNVLKNDLVSGLEIVKNYIIDNDLMVVGGMAIDLSLRIKNDNLYDEEYSIPDYDIISPDNVNHANKVGAILCDNKLKNISIIPAIHKTTVRVQMSGYTLFDATFVPNYIYDKIPHMLYKKIKFIDPIFQKIDQFISLSFLFDVTGAQYNVQHRLVKDDERKDLLGEYYNLKYKDDIPDLEQSEALNRLEKINLKNDNVNLSLDIFNNIEIKKIVIKENNNVLYNKSDVTSNLVYKYFDDNKINFDDIYYSIDCDITHHGSNAYNLIYYAYIEMINNLKSNNIISKDDLSYIKKIDNNIEIKPKIIINKNNISFSHYKEMPFIIINNNNNIDLVINNIKKVYNVSDIKKKENLAHKIPNHVSCNIKIDSNNYDLQIFDLYGRMLSTNIINIGTNIFNISNYNYLLSYFLFNYYYSVDEDSKILYKFYYLSLLNIIKCSKYIVEKYNNVIVKYNINVSWCKYSINTLGFENKSENYYYFIKNFNYLVVNNKNLNDLPPKNYIGYPNCDITKIFDDKNSPYYNKFENDISETNFAKDLEIQINMFK